MTHSNFDPSYFQDPITGKFRFPAYTLDWKGLVQIRDNTNYKEQLSKKLSGDKAGQFDLAKFEKAKIKFSIDVESFEDFFERFPETCFSEGIRWNDLTSIFYGIDCPEDGIWHSFDNFEPAIRLGLVAPDNTTERVEEYWRGHTLKKLADIAIINNINPSSSMDKLIDQLMEHKVPVENSFVKPTQFAAAIYKEFVNLYLQDIINNTIHFHPVLLKALWTKVEQINVADGIIDWVEQTLKNPYWQTGNTPELLAGAEPTQVSNSVFTFEPPTPSMKQDFDKKPTDPNDIAEKKTYLKARPGSFDESYFIKSGKFCFPDYTDNPDALVFVGDNTKYKKTYLEKLSRDLTNFSLDDLERNFEDPDWEVRSFIEFVEDLPNSFFEEGITGKRVAEYIDYFSDDKEIKDAELTAMKHLMSATDALVTLGYFIKSDQFSFNQAATWCEMPLPALAAISKENGLKPSKSKYTTVWNLINNKVPLPVEHYHPTRKLHDLFLSLVNIYLEDIVKNTNYFHPLYIQSLWNYIEDDYTVDLINDKAKEHLLNPYWKDRLIETKI